MPTLDDRRPALFFEDLGAGLPLVLGHSFLCSGDMWAPQRGPLAERYRVLNVDFRGHGRSGPAEEAFTLYDLVADVVAVLDDRGIERAVWAGLSIGGMVALRAALRVPERVAGLILMDTHAGPERIAKKIQYRAMGLGVRMVGIRPFLPTVMSLFFARTTRRNKPALVEEWRGRVAGAHIPSMLRTLHALTNRDDLVPRLGEIRVPALVVVGADDRSLPPSCSRQIAARLPDASLVVVPEAGHLSNLEQPERVTTEMVRFLNERCGGQARPSP